MQTPNPQAKKERQASSEQRRNSVQAGLLRRVIDRNRRMNYFNYFTEIEDEFVKRRGSHLLVSPLDWSLMEVWKQRGIPLHVVLRGINDSFDGYDTRISRGRKVNSLFYCQQEVESLFLEYCESRVGSESAPSQDSHTANGVANGNGNASPVFTRVAITDHLRERLETIKRLAERHNAVEALTETFERVTLRLEQIIEDVRTVGILSPEGLETDLTMIEEVILDGLKDSLGPEQLKEIRQEGHQKLRSYKKSMGPEVYKQTMDNYVARRLREQ
ncbi:MAG: hypothetical protein M3X11_00790, partial [Acidobacteriota bacterium]|nr:hypothetical protein [Acidobacteriota bacterium]